MLFCMLVPRLEPFTRSLSDLPLSWNLVFSMIWKDPFIHIVRRMRRVKVRRVKDRYTLISSNESLSCLTM